MQVSQLVFSWSHEAPYSCESNSYEGSAIKDYDFEISNTPLLLGDSRHFESKSWIVASVENYSPTDGTDNGFSVVVLTLHGEAPGRDPWEGSGERLLYACISPDDVMFGLLEHPEAIPEIGHEDRNMPGWVVSTIREFEPDGQSTYDRVLVCWCSAVVVPTPKKEPVSMGGKS